MTRHNARHPETGRFAPKVPDAASVDNVSGDPVGEHDEPGDQTHYEVHDFARGPVSHWLPHRRAVMVDAETGEHIADVPEHIMRALVPGSVPPRTRPPPLVTLWRLSSWVVTNRKSALCTPATHGTPAGSGPHPGARAGYGCARTRAPVSLPS